MFNPIEMFQVQGGAGTEAMARQFGLSTEQTARALEALMPALTLGIQRGAGLDPTGFARMFGMPDAARSAAPQGLDALGQMFGSAQLMQAVLQQASAASGVGSQVLRQMLPMIAGAVVASIVHVMLNQPEPARQPAAPPQPQPFPFAPVWADMARAFLPAEAPPAAPPRPAASRPSEGKSGDGRSGDGRSGRPRSAPSGAAARPPADAGAAGKDAGADMIEQMFRTGAEVQGQNIRAMQELFETFWPSPGQPPVEPADDPRPPAPETSAPKRAPRPGRREES